MGPKPRSMMCSIFCGVDTFSNDGHISWLRLYHNNTYLNNTYNNISVTFCGLHSSLICNRCSCCGRQLNSIVHYSVDIIDTLRRGVSRHIGQRGN